MGKMKYVLVIGLFLALSACTDEEIAGLSANLPSVSPSSTPTLPSSCWSDSIALNGTENLPYPTESQAAGNTYYACTGFDSHGAQPGIWLGFYTDGTVYFGIPGILGSGSSDTETCEFTFRDGAAVLGVATSATLDADNHLTGIDLNVTVIGESIHFDCHLVN